MKISTIPQLYRNLNRWREIIAILSKYGLADWISRLDLDFAKGLLKDRGGELLAKHTRETRIRLALVELGPAFIKLGQILSTRPDVVGIELAEELQSLQTDVQPDPPEVAQATIEAELGQPIEQIFDDYEPYPMASASIGQVHRAQLKSGLRVVIKVQHAGIVERIHVDLEILSALAQMAQRIPEFVNYRPQATVAEFQRMLRRELDFGREERYLQQFAQDFAGNPTVRIPAVIPELSTSRVLTMERLEGVKLNEVGRNSNGQFDLAEIARRGANLYLEMIFVNGVYHADPHPGNIVVLDHNVIGLLDFGMIGRLDEQLRENIEEMLLAITNRDAESLTSMIVRLGSVPPDLDYAALGLDAADFVGHYAIQSMADFNLSGGAQGIDRDDPPLPDHATGQGGDADQGAGDAGGDVAAGVPAVQLDGGDATVSQQDVAAAAIADTQAEEDAPHRGRAGISGRDRPPPDQRYPASSANRPVRCASGPSRAGAERQSPGAGDAGQRVISRLVATTESQHATPVGQCVGVGSGRHCVEPGAGAAAAACHYQVGSSRSPQIGARAISRKCALRSASDRGWLRRLRR